MRKMNDWSLEVCQLLKNSHHEQFDTPWVTVSMIGGAIRANVELQKINKNIV